MIRNCQVGQRVRIVTKNWIGSESRNKGEIIMSFDSKKGNTGTMVRRMFGMLVIKLDAPNFGELHIRPSEVERLISEVKP